MKSISFIFKVKFTYNDENKLDFTNAIEKGLRFSLWKSEDNFTSAMVYDVCEGSINPGQTKDVVIKTINSELSRTIKRGDCLFWGVPYMICGKVDIIEVIDDVMI